MPSDHSDSHYEYIMNELSGNVVPLKKYYANHTMNNMSIE